MPGRGRGFPGRALALAGLAAVAPALVHARGPASTAAFLKIAPGARAAGLGSAYSGLAEGIEAMHHNPGGLDQSKSREASVSHAQLFQGLTYSHAGYSEPRGWGSWGAGLTYLSQASIEGRGEDRRPTGSFSGGDMALSLSMARRLGRGGGGAGPYLGASLKWVRSELADSSAQGYALDLGLLTPTPAPGLRLGASLRNLGPGLRYLGESFPLPLAVSGGASYQTRLGLLLAAEVSHEVRQGGLEASLGTEYALLPLLSLRGGYLASLSPGPGGLGRELAQAKGLGLGLGLRSKRYFLDYAFTPYGELGHVQRLGFGARW